MNNHKNFREFVFSFCSKDESRPKLTKPNYYDNGLVAATDSHKLMLFNDPNFDKEGCLNSELAVFPVIGAYDRMYETKEIAPKWSFDISQISAITDNIKLQLEYADKYKKCEECDGDGYITCPCCDNEKDCEDCDGSGEIICGKEEEGHYKYPSPDEMIFSINDMPFSIEMMDGLAKSLKMIDASALELYEIPERGKIFFRIKHTEIYILIMGLYYTQEAEIVHTIELKVI